MIQEPLVVSKDFVILCVLPPLERLGLFFHLSYLPLVLSSSPKFHKEKKKTNSTQIYLVAITLIPLAQK